MEREDIERISNMEVEIKNINSRLEKHCNEQRKDFDKLYDKIDAMNEDFKNNFAYKWVEKVVIGMTIAMITVIVMLIVG